MDDREKKLRIKELEELIDKKKKDYDFFKAMQLSLKLVINGCYGAFANKFFVLSNNEIANAITSHGRDIIHTMMYNFEEHFYNHWHNNKEMHKLLGKEYICKVGDKYQAYRIDFVPLGKPKDSLKDLFKDRNISIDILTEHNFKHDEIEVLYDYNIADFSNVKQLDENPIFEDYDGRPKYQGINQIINYGDTDSLYVSFAPIMKSVNFDGIDDDEWGKRFILHMDEIYVHPMINRWLDVYANKFGVKNVHDFELETISKSVLFLKKKHYLKNIVWEDGVSHSDMTNYEPKGIEIIRSSTPPFVRENIYRVINYLFKNVGHVNIYEVLKIVKQIRREFELADIEEISMTTSCTNYSSKVLDDTLSMKCVNAAHFGVKSSCFHNYLLNKHPEYKLKYDLIKSGRIKYFYCDSPLNPVFAYTRSFFPKEICDMEHIHIDYQTQFYKSFTVIVNSFLEPIGLPPINDRMSIINSLFKF